MEGDNIYKKITAVSRHIKDQGIKKQGEAKTLTKKGEFSFKYIRLEEIIPFIVDECQKQQICLTFKFLEEESILKAFNAENPEECVECVIQHGRLILPPNNGYSKNIQEIGSKCTYLRRYLLMQLFNIIENDKVEDNAYRDALLEKKKREDKVKLFQMIKDNGIDRDKAKQFLFDNDFSTFLEEGEYGQIIEILKKYPNMFTDYKKEE